jgi:aryl-alcohol dehydrogenase-like predicted oxidoreductase
VFAQASDSSAAGPARVDAIRAALTSDGRTLAQGALAWIWARSPVAIPIPGFRSAAQIEESAGALAAGRLDMDAMAAVDAALGRGSVAPGLRELEAKVGGAEGPGRRRASARSA